MGRNGYFGVCKLLIQLVWFPRYLGTRCRDTPVFLAMPFSAYFIAVNGAAPLRLKWSATVCTPTRIAPLLSLKSVLEECCIPTLGRAIDFSLPSDGVPNALIQDRPAAVTLFSNIETLGLDVGEFLGGKIHDSPPSELFLSGDWLRIGCGFCRTFPRSAEVSRLSSLLASSVRELNHPWSKCRLWEDSTPRP